MDKNAYRGHRFPPAIIQVTVWMYAPFTLGLRDIEELLAERGLDISYETVRRWFLRRPLKIGQWPGDPSLPDANTSGMEICLG